MNRTKLMRRLRLILIPVLAAATLAAVASSAFAAAPSPVIKDCERHQKLTQHYTISQLQNALATMTQTEIEYGPCYQVIETQLNQQLGGTGASGSATTGGSGGSFISTPVLIILIVILVAGGGFALAARRRGGGDGGGTGGGEGDGTGTDGIGGDGDGDGGTPPAAAT